MKKGLTVVRLLSNCLTIYSFLKINENNKSLVGSRFESDKVNCLHLFPTVMHALQFFVRAKSILLFARITVLQLTVTGLVSISNLFSESSTDSTHLFPGCKTRTEVASENYHLESTVLSSSTAAFV